MKWNCGLFLSGVFGELGFTDQKIDFIYSRCMYENGNLGTVQVDT